MLSQVGPLIIAFVTLLSFSNAAPVVSIKRASRLGASHVIGALNDTLGASNDTFTPAKSSSLESGSGGCTLPASDGASMGIALKSASKKVQTATLCTSPSADGASPYNCGCSAAKTNLHNLGADSLDLAIALLEVGGSLTADYTLGDGKTGDSANFSIFKYNWFLIRTACTQFAGQQESDWNNGAVLNTDNGAAILCLRQQLAHYGDPWWGAQRDGSEGLSDSSATITQYKNGAQAIQNYLDQGHLTDDMAAYVEVPAI